MGGSHVWPLCIKIVLSLGSLWASVTLESTWKVQERPEGILINGLILCMYVCVCVSEKFHWPVWGLSLWLPSASICSTLITVSSFGFRHQPLGLRLLFREMACTWFGSCVSLWVWEPQALDHSHHPAPKSSHMTLARSSEDPSHPVGELGDQCDRQKWRKPT